MATRLEPEEKETIVRFDKTVDPMSVFTYERTLQTHLKRAGAEIILDNGSGGLEFSMPKDWFRIPRPRVKRRKASV
jgi:hypothetical protein